ncbi:unnamed protein product [Prorocentrum cordatum]|uniref:PDZ domain-containing protein n=1 Tax=Prorocentrum cordatum TaxID=2364126 RepID=A0ABN9U657_9DINO|nr:unnamed protein product [Polarella glacialis]
MRDALLTTGPVPNTADESSGQFTLQIVRTDVPQAAVRHHAGRRAEDGTGRLGHRSRGRCRAAWAGGTRGQAEGGCGGRRGGAAAAAVGTGRPARPLADRVRRQLRRGGGRARGPARTGRQPGGVRQPPGERGQHRGPPLRVRGGPWRRWTGLRLGDQGEDLPHFGLRQGDRLLRANGAPISELEACKAALGSSMTLVLQLRRPPPLGPVLRLDELRPGADGLAPQEAARDAGAAAWLGEFVSRLGFDSCRAPGSVVAGEEEFVGCTGPVSTGRTGTDDNVMR